jgi:hypothetical protein
LVALAGVALLWMGSGCIAGTASSRESHGAISDGQLPHVRTVKLPYRSYGMARVAKGALFVTVDSGKGLLDTALRYDLGTGSSRVLFSAPADIAWLTVNDRWLVWESEKKLYAQPVDGGTRRTLAASREAYGPTLEGDVVAWVDREEGAEARIVTFNLRTGEKREVARTQVAQFYNNFMQIREGKLLWTDIYDGTGHYLVRDLRTGATQDYSMPATRFRYPGYALRTGDLVYSINFDRYDEWDWSTQQLGSYSLKTGDSTKIGKEGSYINMLVVGSDAVAVIDSEQRLLVGPADGTYPKRDLSSTLKARVDGVQVSNDGITAVAGRSLPERKETTLFLFELR